MDWIIEHLPSVGGSRTLAVQLLGNCMHSFVPVEKGNKSPTAATFYDKSSVYYQFAVRSIFCNFLPVFFLTTRVLSLGSSTSLRTTPRA